MLGSWIWVSGFPASSVENTFCYDASEFSPVLCLRNIRGYQSLRLSVYTQWHTLTWWVCKHRSRSDPQHKSRGSYCPTLIETSYSTPYHAQGEEHQCGVAFGKHIDQWSFLPKIYSLQALYLLTPDELEWISPYILCYITLHLLPTYCILSYSQAPFKRTWGPSPWVLALRGWMVGSSR